VSDYFAWFQFAVWGLIYTALVFQGELSDQGPRIFSKVNAKPLSAIVLIHLSFLLLIFICMRVAPYIEPHLSHFLTDTLFRRRGSEVSILDLLFVLALFPMRSFELRRIYLGPADKP